MHRIALTIAVVGFFVLAGVAWLGGCSTFRCALRAVIGAAAIYVGVRVALRLSVSIIADAIVKARMSQEQKGKKSNW